ncbi:hypothetical protein BJV82DRAFT_195895 [Fennellomyces sp. T-0311]|nr:hypothetical protein BJV82DRAFT_195895 [Fennellomyces sp. T-0311]
MRNGAVGPMHKNCLLIAVHIADLVRPQKRERCAATRLRIIHWPAEHTTMITGSRDLTGQYKKGRSLRDSVHFVFPILNKSAAFFTCRFWLPVEQGRPLARNKGIFSSPRPSNPVVGRDLQLGSQQDAHRSRLYSYLLRCESPKKKRTGIPRRKKKKKEKSLLPAQTSTGVQVFLGTRRLRAFL